MDSQYVPLSLVKPGDDENLVADFETVNCIGQGGDDLEPRVRGALGPLLRCLASFFERRPDGADRP